ncbi:uncharacterized protein [Oryza sativa Japonica Group]|uniref:uncharacterized protein isoform X1 n=1 Tax=Oryza sativa subsp. japonica TaxID=39947 RepID=UPI00339C1CE1
MFVQFIVGLREYSALQIIVLLEFFFWGAYQVLRVKCFMSFFEEWEVRKGVCQLYCTLFVLSCFRFTCPLIVRCIVNGSLFPNREIMFPQRNLTLASCQALLLFSVLCPVLRL